MSSRGSPDLRLPLLATRRDSDPFHQAARTGSGGDRDNDSTVGAPGEDALLQDGSTHAPWTPNDSPRSTQVRRRQHHSLGQHAWVAMTCMSAGGAYLRPFSAAIAQMRRAPSCHCAGWS